MDYPNSDEEFELMHGDELELLRENERDIDISEPPTKSRRSLDFTQQVKELPTRSIPSDQGNTPCLLSGVSGTVLPSASTLFETEFQPLTENDIAQAVPQPLITENLESRKRSVHELFGEVDDISDDEVDDSRAKKHKSSKNDDDLVLIDHILELRKLAKQRQNSIVLSNKDYVTANNDHNKYNLSYQVPKYSFVVVTRNNGERIYVRCHSEAYETEEIQKIAKKSNFAGVMGQTFKDIWKQAEEYMNQNLDVENEPQLPEVSTNAADISILKESTKSNTHLWVDMYKPQKYLELLSDESTNRTLLRWLKLWDKVVFNRKPKPKIIKADSQELNNKFRKPELSMNLDAHGRPEHKVVLLCGPPGLGKTTLAHMVAKHAGYNVVEVNASDDRSAEKFKMVLENATQMRSVVDKENRPNCLVFDEIDGAPSASIDFLIKFVNGTVSTSKKKKGAKQAANILKRPIICICNDVYVPALRPLRQIAFVVNFPPTVSARLAERLTEIARHQHVKTDLGALLALCEKSGNDIRSCLSVLHFFKSLSKPITLSQVYKTSIGQKDMQKGLFAVWQDIFQIQRSKHKTTSINTDDNNQENKQENSTSLRNRMRKILQIVNAFGDYEKLAQGVFENYASLYMKDSSLLSTCHALEWFCFTDALNRQIYSLQNYSLSSYLPYSFVVWHFVFASLSRPKLTYPSSGYETKLKASRNTALLTEVMKGMQPSVRAFTYSNSLRLDTLPLLSHIILPVFRPVNLHLYTQEEKKQLNNVVSVMIDYNLNYVQERTPEGNYIFNIDPNIDEVTFFPGLKPKRFVSDANKQLIAHEVGVEKMRRTEIHKTGDQCTETTNKTGINDKNKQNEKQLPNHLQKLKPKAVKPKSETVVTKDFFGRIIAKPSAAGKTGPELKNDIWYQYKEGYNNAVRKRIRISTLM